MTQPDPILAAFTAGALTLGWLAIGVFFLKFWRRTGDLLFLAFAAAFMIEGVNRLGFFFLEHPNEGSPTIYLVRLFAFLLIVAAIVMKNRSRGR